MDRQTATEAVKERLTEYVENITEHSSKGNKRAYVCPICGSGTGRNKTGAFTITKDGLKWKCFISNGEDAIELCRNNTFDLILLDEMMPGLTGLETLERIKDIQPTTPIVMVTKSEEEDIMNQAIGRKIADYLIKPVNPSQILIALKKNIHKRELVTEVTQSGYRQDFRKISMLIDDRDSFDDWTEIYRLLTKWELELSNADKIGRASCRERV